MVVEQQKNFQFLTSKYKYREEVKKSSVNGQNHLVVNKLLRGEILNFVQNKTHAKRAEYTQATYQKKMKLIFRITYTHRHYGYCLFVN